MTADGAPTELELVVRPDAAAAARHAAAWLAERAREAVAARGRFTLAVSGGSTPGPAFAALAEEDVPWEHVHLFQVDERVAPAGHPDRNLVGLREALVDRVPLPEANLHPLPVDAVSEGLEDVAGEPDPGTRTYVAFSRWLGKALRKAVTEAERELVAAAGEPPVLDVVQLGLGGDGHTASLVPGDPALEVTDGAVAATGRYAGRHRLTLTYPTLDAARHRLWLATGAGKADMVARLVAGDTTIPAGRVSRAGAVLVVDAPAAAGATAG